MSGELLAAPRLPEQRAPLTTYLLTWGGVSREWIFSWERGRERGSALTALRGQRACASWPSAVRGATCALARVARASARARARSGPSSVGVGRRGGDGSCMCWDCAGDVMRAATNFFPPPTSHPPRPPRRAPAARRVTCDLLMLITLADISLESGLALWLGLQRAHASTKHETDQSCCSVWVAASSCLPWGRHADAMPCAPPRPRAHPPLPHRARARCV